MNTKSKERPRQESPEATFQHSGEAGLLSLSEAAAHLRVSIPTLRRWLRARRLAYVRCGHALRIESEEIRRFIACNRYSAKSSDNRKGAK